MKKNFLFILIIVAVLLAGAYLFLIFFSSSSRPDLAGNQPPDQAVPAAGFKSVAQINQGQTDGETYRVRAYVVKITPCPPCPQGSACKPCMPDNLVISDLNKSLSVFPEVLPESDLLVFVNLPGGLNNFQLGQQYNFTLIRSEDKFYNNGPAYQLISFTPAE